MTRRSSTALTTAVICIFAVQAATAQQCSTGGGRVAVEVLDVTGAAVVGATVHVAGDMAGRSDGRGHYNSSCIAAGSHSVAVQAPGFADLVEHATAGGPVLTVRLKPVTVMTTVNAAEEEPVSTESVGGTKTLDQKDIKQLADDPDEFARQLQVLAAAAGGAPGQAIIAVDGFQNSGRIPPKSAIAFIRVNPDLFSAEYERPPYQGGRVEIYTKPGQSKLHGALFTTQSAQFMNAKDPFAPSRAAIGKQRYGFELGGPVVTNHSDFFVALEHRQIDQFAVVNAVTLDSEPEPGADHCKRPHAAIAMAGQRSAGQLSHTEEQLHRHLHRDCQRPDQRGCGWHGTATGKLQLAAERTCHTPHQPADHQRDYAARNPRRPHVPPAGRHRRNRQLHRCRSQALSPAAVLQRRPCAATSSTLKLTTTSFTSTKNTTSRWALNCSTPT